MRCSHCSEVQCTKSRCPISVTLGGRKCRKDVRYAHVLFLIYSWFPKLRLESFDPFSSPSPLPHHPPPPALYALMGRGWQRVLVCEGSVDQSQISGENASQPQSLQILDRLSHEEPLALSPAALHHSTTRCGTTPLRLPVHYDYRYTTTQPLQVHYSHHSPLRITPQCRISKTIRHLI